MRLAGAIAICAYVMLGCGAAAHPTPRFGVLDASWRTPSAIEGTHAAHEIVAGMHESGLSDAREVHGEPCDDDVECLRRVGESNGVERLVAPSLLALGATVLLRASVIDVSRSTRAQTHQEVIADASAARVDTAARALGIELARPHSPETPWYAQWWPWTIAGAIVAGVIVTIAVVVATSAQGPDVVVRP